MMSPALLSLPQVLVVLPLLLSLPCFTVSTQPLGTNNHSQAQMLQSMSMAPPERETLFHVMETMSSDRDWRFSNPDPCMPGSFWPGIECKPGSDNHLHVTRLDFGATPNPTCKNTATFPSEVFDLPYLQSLFFFNCFKTTKTSLSMPPPAYKPAAYASLQQLSLKSNPSLIGPIPPHISSLSSLQVLTLSQNHLHGKIPEGISGLTSLIHLDLSYNSLTGSIPAQLGSLSSLTGLDLSYNSLTGSIPPSIGQLSQLQKLDLSSNSLSGSVPESLENLGLLAFLALSNNKLSGQLPKGLPKLQNLQYFIMDGNPMFVPLPYQLGRLSKLQELRLANSGYSGSIPRSFALLANLTTLSLENNRLTGEIPAGLSGLSRMYHLNLSRNMLAGVVPFNAGFIKRLGKNLDLSGNPGLCLNGPESSDSISVGVEVCGGNRSASSMQQPLRSSARAPSSLFSNFPLLLGCLALWPVTGF
ncbi:uncharacterized protein [Elaeis guineensis]|uniref:Receptor like protein 29 n=1 Tax=Elaeis guineensis var. tenera TaxID=51953 RepID=A0A6I9R1G7_ELAGV|nr:receptor like protein 29 [Elaeis guineensis]